MDGILEQRQERIISLLKEDKLLSTFLIISILSLIFSIFNLGIFSSKSWLFLFAFSALSAFLTFFKKRRFALYPLAGWVAWLAFEIRTSNLGGLRDITTGGWTLGPDLDPFLFLRWAKYIVANGALMVHDSMRYIPLGYDTARELKLLSYLIAWFHNIASSFGSTSIEQSAALFPAFMFIPTVIAFFLLVRKIFLSSLGEQKSSGIALIASFFLSVIPALIPRTIAGIPEKESAAFVFFFLAFYFFICGWDSDKSYKKLTFGVLAGASTAAMALVWGAYIFVFVIIGLSVFIAFILNKVDLNNFYLYSIWLISSAIFTFPFTERYSLLGWFASPTTGLAVAVFGILIVHLIITKTFLGRYSESGAISKIPKPILSIIISIVLGVIISIVLFGPSFILGTLNNLKTNLVSPSTDRLGATVAENKQPFFNEWAGSFGPSIKGIPLTFWLFFIGSVYLFWNMAHPFKRKERVVLTLSYLFFLVSIIFSRYSPSSLFNGTNSPSLLLYSAGLLFFICTFGYYYYNYYKAGELDKLKEISFGLLLAFSLFFLSIIAARGAVRLTMMMVPPASIIVGYLAVTSLDWAKKARDDTLKTISWIVIFLILISTAFAGYQFYGSAKSVSESYVPSAYNQQWQKAMSWVRGNTPENAVFGHWWDYGYWVQTLGERATVLDGGNSLPYWDYLMGRHALTGSNTTSALEFLYSHNTTHFLIDSTDIGKYPAFASIGSDENYDRYSWINTFAKDPKQTLETKNMTTSVYAGGSPLDGDLIYTINGTRVFIPPSSSSGLGAILIERNAEGKITKNPEGVFVYQGNQYRIPLRYAYDSSSQKLMDFNSGLEAGVFIYPIFAQDAGGFKMDQDGVLMYLSPRTINSQLGRLYLFREDNNFFKLVHSEDDFVVAQLKQQNITTSDFVYYQGIRGPIRIWEINYPKEIKLNPAYLETDYPDIRLTQPRQ